MLNLIKLIVPILLLMLLVFNISWQWDAVSVVIADIDWFLLSLSFLVSLTIYPEGAYSWVVILKRFGINVGYAKLISIWLITLPSRYIPGSVWQYLGRIEVARHAGIPGLTTTTSLLYETIFCLISGLLIGLFSLFFLNLSNLNYLYWVFSLPLLAVMIHPNVLRRFVLLIAKITKQKIKLDMTPLNNVDILFVIPLFILNFMINGLALTLLVSSFGVQVDATSYLMYSGFFAISWVLGFVSIFSPGGIGVTEASLAYLMSFSMPFSLASLIALSYRFMLLLSEFMSFTVVMGYSLKGKK